MAVVHWVGTALRYISIAALAIALGAVMPTACWHRSAEPHSSSEYRWVEL